MQFGILTILVSIAIVKLILRLNDATHFHSGDVLGGFAIMTALGAIAVVLCMPLRSPELTTDHISAPFDPPTSRFRSPEENLTPWQFMSVSWMSTLIALGSMRQLEDEDVWSLSYEFQHKALHQRFRELRGSVIKRLLEANWIDLAILTALALLESLASESAQRQSDITMKLMWIRFCRTCAPTAAFTLDGESQCTKKARRNLCNTIVGRPAYSMPVFRLQSVVWTKIL